jgi:transcriptional regulator with XRE-family HTH domain
MDEVTSDQNQTPDLTESDFSAIEHSAARLSANKIGYAMGENSEQTIRRILSSYEIGNKLRQLRLRKKIALIDLGKHTGLSASMLSQLENGKLIPTLATLARISMVFDVGLDYFFAEKKRRRTFLIVRTDERIRFPDRPSSPKPDYFFECLAFSAQEKSLQAYLAEFPRRSPLEITDHFHEGAEFLHVLDGSVGIRFQGEEHVLNQGDSVYFDSSEPHAYRGLTRHPAKAVVVTTPPRL